MKIKEMENSKVFCKTCVKDIPLSGVRIQCEVCTNFFLCLECFCQGSELGGHKNFHPYSVLDEVSEALFEEGWIASQDIALLDAIKKFGWGNWDGVAEFVNELNPDARRVSKSDAEKHYLAILKKTQEPNIKIDCDELDDQPWYDPLDDLPIHPSLIDANVGFRPKRRDFEVVWCNDAEKVLADMEICTFDKPLERQLKLKAIQIYNQRLNERECRKEFLIRRGLNYGREKKRSKPEREIYSNLCRLARFVSKAEHDQFVQGLLNEHRLREQIAQLQHWRMMGIKTLTEGARFERNRKKSADSRPATSHGAQKRSLKRILDNSSNERTPKRVKPKEAFVETEEFQLLSETEQKLCESLRLNPTRWVSLKEKLRKKIYLHGLLNPGVTKQMMQVRLSDSMSIHDIPIKIGWVEPRTLPIIVPPGSKKIKSKKNKVKCLEDE